MAIYVGGDTTELEYNFFTKTAGSMVECPMKCYYVASPEPLLPNDNKWIEFDQTKYDKLKNQDNNTQSIATTTVGEKAQILVELDLNGLCNSLYGGSNSVLRSNVKAANIEYWMYAEGDNNGIKDYKISLRTLDNTVWGTVVKYDNAKQITKLSRDIISDAKYYITTDNKIYVLLVSEYPASATIPSKVFLDYINIKLKINRQPDRIEPIDIELGEEWSLLFKGVSYNWDNTTTDKYLFWLVGTSTNIAFRYINGNIGRLTVQYGSQYLTSPNAPNLRTKQWECNNYLIQYKNNIYTCYHLDGQGLRKITFTDNIGFKKGIYKLYLCQHTGYGYQADAFIPDIPIKYNQAFSDEEAEIILKGKNPNLLPNFKDSRWTIHTQTIVSEDGKSITINATETWLNNYILLPILPNNKYQLKCQKTANARFDLDFYYGNTIVLDTPSNNNSIIEFTTPSICNIVKINCKNPEVGTFTFSNLELRRLD
ncbi:hypothetical protein CF065_18690 [Clostridium sporogenes]